MYVQAFSFLGLAQGVLLSHLNPAQGPNEASASSSNDNNIPWNSNSVQLEAYAPCHRMVYTALCTVKRSALQKA